MTLIYAHPITGFGDNADAGKAGWVPEEGEGTSGFGTMTVSTTGGRFGDGELVMVASGTGARWRLNPPAASVGVSFVHFALDMQGPVPVPTGRDPQFLRMFNNNGVDVCLELWATPSGALLLYNQAGVLIGTSAPNLLNYTLGIHQAFAVEAEIGSATGYVKVYVDSVLIFDVASTDLDNGHGGGADSIAWETVAITSSVSNFVRLALSQVIVYDSSGAEVNAYLGDKRVYAGLPTSDETKEWTRSAGVDNYVLVNDPLNAGSDEDGTYVEGDAVADDFYELSDLPVNVSGIVALVVNAEIRKTDAGTLANTLQLAVKSGTGTIASSSEVFPATNYEEHQRFFFTEPGGLPWTEAKINAARIGQRLV